MRRWPAGRLHEMTRMRSVTGIGTAANGARPWGWTSIAAPEWVRGRVAGVLTQLRPLWRNGRGIRRRARQPSRDRCLREARCGVRSSVPGPTCRLSSPPGSSPCSRASWLRNGDGVGGCPGPRGGRQGLMDAAVLTGPPEYLAHLVPGAGGARCFLPLTKRPAVSHNGQSLAGGVGAHGTGRP